MIKLSFDTDKFNIEPIEEQFNNKIVKITLKGVILFPDEYYIPFVLKDFIENYPGYIGMYNGGFYIKAIGTAKKNSEDSWDPVIGYKIAKSRATIKLYRFMAELCDTYIDYLLKVLGMNEVRYAPTGVIGDSEKYYTFLNREKKYYKSLLNSLN